MVRTKTLPGFLCSILAAVAALAAAAVAAPAPALAAPASVTGPVTPACAWYEFSVTTDNEGAQDSAATYWLLPYTVQDGLSIVLGGHYPDSRYTSLQAYGSGGGLYTVNGVSSALADYQIQPDRGSVNPWQSWGRPRPGGSAFTVTLRSGVAPGQVNTLPLAPAGTAPGAAGYLFYRVYLPAFGDIARVPLPTVTFALDGVSKQVPRCQPGATMPAAAAGAHTAAAATPAGTVEFARRQSSGTFPNANSGYLTAEVTPPGGSDVLVIQGKAPTASRGSHPSPWPDRFADLQYWSLCNYVLSSALPLVANQLPGGQIDYGCRYDSQAAVDHHGYYTFVVGTEAQRPAIERIPGATFLPFSATQPTTPHVLLLRDMLASPGFAEAVQNVPQNDNPASAAAVMGPYYPRAAICPLTTLASGGPSACLAGTR
jgi:hypothetical protein